KKGNIVVAEIKELHNNGLEVVLDNGLTGFIKVNDISNDKSKRKADAFAVGEKIEALVLGFERGTRRVNLSIRALEVKREKEALEKYGSADSGASLGDILGVALDKKPENEK
ncbi:MAG: S1 RNA-binding domain-containing protein, partial [Alphaproteobacteria bacterium]|nr:S1 RNA-binding domain-containing protein [Alphaproteobacteria bacterium]